MIEVDGSKRSGSGTLLRLSIAMATILGEPLHIWNIRKGRKQPGLRPQHLEAVLASARMCNARVRGAAFGSQEIWFSPNEIKGGMMEAEIGTAGSIPMLIMTVLPICMFAKQPVTLRILKGGTDVRHSPTINYIGYVLFPILLGMGLKAQLEVHKYGYYPKGLGEVTLSVKPSERLFPIALEDFGKIYETAGISVCTFLADRKVARRQAEEAKRLMKSEDFMPEVRIVNDYSNPTQKGSSLALWVKTDSGAVLGGDAVGEIHKSSEAVAREAVTNLLLEVRAKATVDIHLADMLIPYMALASGKSVYLTRTLTDHLRSNIWLASEILEVDFRTERKGSLYRIVKE